MREDVRKNRNAVLKVLAEIDEQYDQQVRSGDTKWKGNVTLLAIIEELSKPISYSALKNHLIALEKDGLIQRLRKKRGQSFRYVVTEAGRKHLEAAKYLG